MEIKNNCSKINIIIIIIAIFIVRIGYGQNTFPSTGNVGIGTTAPSSDMEIWEQSESRLGNAIAPSKSMLKLSRSGTSGYAYDESAEFRIGHGGPSAWGSKLDLFINGASNQNNIPDQQVMTWLYNGNVGIGTTSPRSVLDVGAFISAGTVGTVMARQEEGDAYGDGTFLGVRAFGTQFSAYNGKAFSLEHDFYGHVNSAINFFRGGDQTGGYMTFSTNDGTEQMRIDPSGSVSIGTTTSHGYKLAVNGNILTQEVNVTTSGWPDYIFKPNYKLASLDSLSAQINSLGHLPNMPSAEEVEAKGLSLGDISKKQQQKIEELTLYLIEQNKKVSTQDKKIEEQNKRIINLEQQNLAVLQALKKLSNQLEKAKQ